MRPVRSSPGRCSFFEHGLVETLEDDERSGQLHLAVTLPACVMQAATPCLLGAGILDSYEVRSPLAVWIPTIGDAGFRDELSQGELPARVNAEVRRRVRELVELFVSTSSTLKFSGDLVPMLPMGVYVRFRMRCSADKLAPAVEAMGGAAGMAELKYALGSVLADALRKWGRVA